MFKSYAQLTLDGMWHNNPGLVQLLGLCPLLAVTTSLVNGLGLGVATLLTLVISNVVVSLIRKWIPTEIRIPVYVLIIACAVTAIELAMNAYFFELYKILGIFIPLIVTNCTILSRAEAFASNNSVPRAFVDGLAMGIGFTLVLITLGGLRELVGHGTLLGDAQLIFGDAGRALTITVVDGYRGFLLAVVPPGAFFGLGLLIAVKNVIDRRAARIEPIVQSVPTTSAV